MSIGHPDANERRRIIISSKAVATKEPTGAVVPVDPEVQALIDAQAGEIDNDLITSPILKIGQPLTREVQDESAEVGEFIDTASGEGIGNKVEFIVAYYQKGRFAADRDTNRAYVAFGSTIPAHWSDLVGEEFVGTPFAEYPDAEETYKERVNNKEIPWGKGPLVSTTHNFTGLALVEDIETHEVEYRPVRLSLQRTNVPSVKKWMTLKASALRNRPFWDLTFVLTTEKKQFDRGAAYLLKVSKGRATTADEKSAAVDLATAVVAGRVTDNSEEAQDAPVAPEAKGGLAV